MPKAGTIILCTNNHPMGYCVRDVGLGDMNWGDAFRWAPDADFDVWSREGGIEIKAGEP